MQFFLVHPGFVFWMPEKKNVLGLECCQTCSCRTCTFISVAALLFQPAPVAHSLSQAFVHPLHSSLVEIMKFTANMAKGQHDEDICEVIDLFFSFSHFDAGVFIRPIHIPKTIQAEMGSPADVAEFAAMEPHPRKFAIVCKEPKKFRGTMCGGKQLMFIHACCNCQGCSYVIFLLGEHDVVLGACNI